MMSKAKLYAKSRDAVTILDRAEYDTIENITSKLDKVVKCTHTYTESLWEKFSGDRAHYSVVAKFSKTTMTIRVISYAYNINYTISADQLREHLEEVNSILADANICVDTIMDHNRFIIVKHNLPARSDRS